MLSKNWWTVIFVLCLMNFAAAQTEKGNMTAGGSIGMNISRQGIYRAFNFTIAPRIGYFPIKNLMIAANLGIGMSSSNNYKDTISRFYLNTSFVPSLRYFVGKNNVKFFLEMSGGYVGQTSIVKSSIHNIDGWTVKPNLGAAYFFNKNLGLETSFYYSATKYQRIDLQQNFGIALGLAYYFDPTKRSPKPEKTPKTKKERKKDIAK